MSNQKVIMSPLNSQNPVFRVLLVFLQLKVVPSVTLLSSSRPTLYNSPTALDAAGTTGANRV